MAFPKKEQDTGPVKYARLNEPQYKALESSVVDPFVSEKTTDLQAGFQLGIQHVLKKLREGFVI